MPRFYQPSDEMNSEFELLAEKVARLAELTDFLRRENAELRRDIVALTEENGEMHQRMDEAHERVTALLAQLPLENDSDKDAA